MLIKSLLLVLEKSHNLVLSSAIVTNNQSNTQAHKKQAKRDERKRGEEKAKVFKNHFRSGGEENERRMANNVMRGRRVYDGYLVYLGLSIYLPGNGALNPSCYL